MKRLLCLLFTALLVLPLALTGYASETNPSGTCGEGLSWVLSGHTLTVSGSGDMTDECPWEAYKDDIRSLVLTGGVSYIGKEAFANCDKLREIDFGDSLREIGEKAFYDCDRISQVRVPETFRIFGPQCFRDCGSLTQVYCDGNMPSFKDSCLWNGNYVTVYHDLSHPWPEEAVSVLMNNFGGRLTVIPASPDVLEEATEASDGQEDAQDGTQATEEDTIDDLDDLLEKYADATVPTDPIVVPTVPLATEPPTTAPTTAPATEPTTVPTTQAPTVPPTQAPTVSQEPTVPPTQEPEKTESKGWIGLVLIAGVLTFLLIGTLIFRGVSHKGGRYS